MKNIPSKGRIVGQYHTTRVVRIRVDASGLVAVCILAVSAILAAYFSH